MLGRSIGLTQEQVLALRTWQESDLFDPVDEVVLEYVEAWKVRRAVSDELYGRLQQHFTTRQIIDLCFTCGVADTINRFHATFQTDVDEDTLAHEDVAEGSSVLHVQSAP